MSFKVGDIIKGKESSNRMHSVTDDRGIYEVIKIEENNYIKVRLIYHKKYMDKLGNIYGVNPKYFKKADYIKSNFIE